MLCLQVAWAANDYSVQDCVDHEVYKIIGRHGTNMVTRGIIAAEAFHAYGFEGDDLLCGALVDFCLLRRTAIRDNTYLAPGTC